MEPETLILAQLRALRNDVAGVRSEVRDGRTNVERRLGRIETACSELHADYSGLSVRIDQVVADVRVLKGPYGTAG